MILPSVSGLGTIPTLGPVNCIIKATATTNNAAIGPVGAATCKRKITKKVNFHSQICTIHYICPAIYKMTT